jgi:hypothetical protein
VYVDTFEFLENLMPEDDFCPLADAMSRMPAHLLNTVKDGQLLQLRAERIAHHV